MFFKQIINVEKKILLKTRMNLDSWIREIVQDF